MISNFSKVLLLSNLGVDMGQPGFRHGSYNGTLVPIARLLEKQKGVSARIMASAHITQQLLKDAAATGKSCPTIHTLDEERLTALQAEDFMIKSYHEALPEDRLHEIHEIILSALDGWTPDIIISWEAPTGVFRSLFPEATVLDIMPGMFMRPPYPKMISFDPVGLYSSCWFSRNDVETLQVSDEILGNHIKIRDLYQEHYSSLNVPSALAHVLKKAKLAESTLVPLQISQYFGWCDNTHYETQFELLADVQRHIPTENSAIYTQYIGSLVSEYVIHEHNLAYLRARYPNFLYDGRLEKLDNITQYLLPGADTVISVSSTIGLQAKFFGKKLISPSQSHLSYLADSNDLAGFDKVPNRSRDSFMAAYLGRTNFLHDRLLTDPSYLVTILNEFVERRGEAGIERFPSFETVGNTIQLMTKKSTLKRSTQLFTKAYPHRQLPHDRRVNSLIEAVTAEPVQTVSFDVFDTLVCRTVLSPAHVFELMQSKLRSSHADILGEYFIATFSKSRVGIERLIRFQRDRGIQEASEEMLISEVYGAMLRDYGLSVELADELVAIEQETELACLIPRKEGVRLFNEAVAAGKQTIILSDFIHPSNFVERVLKQCGVVGWDHLFVSSDIGLKKHSGSLFKYVETTLNLDKSTTCHVGDNKHGDFKMAKAHGWDAHHLPAAPVNIRNLIKARKFNLGAINESFVVSTILSGFGNHFLKFGGSRQLDSSESQLIANAHEMGFLLLGPLMHFFSKWILNEARQNGCEQIVFFARDTTLPYKMARQILDNANLTDITICYLPISRLASSGLDIRTAEDMYNVRIDDFEKSKPLLTLFERRFHLEESQIDIAELNNWTDKPVASIKVGDLPAYGIYRIAIFSAKLNWSAVQCRLDEKRRVFQKALTQWGCNTQRKTIAVDFGYKGTIHKKISSFFEQPLIPRFFLSYSDALGRNPVEGCKAFYLSNQVSKFSQSDPLMRYNLLIETMINEHVGSALGYHETEGVVHVLHDNSVNGSHFATISDLHEGALEFSQYWQKYCSVIDEHTSIEPQMLSFLLAEVLRTPTKYEAMLLAGLVFDNGYGGHQPRRIIDLDQRTGRAKSNIWREGAVALTHENSGTSTELSGRRQKFPSAVKTKIFRVFVAGFCNDRLLNKFDRDPYTFFKDSPHSFVRRIGQIV
ncbi:hypothetical protein NBZ79_15945 [Sneathiella marina]|uniref:Uncharacterized protein n=1 Tax=Sneathiella marina TaxID=2950108 RepID=A0ABY4W0H6_9PROT|nr:HAD family hydrolase [Sneathiella marina]USG60658.1 hypothetical protein NBZ79_15945 [Sneathiella marina]